MVSFAGDQREPSRAYHNHHCVTLQQTEIASEKEVTRIGLQITSTGYAKFN